MASNRQTIAMAAGDFPTISRPKGETMSDPRNGNGNGDGDAGPPDDPPPAEPDTFEKSQEPPPAEPDTQDRAEPPPEPPPAEPDTFDAVDRSILPQAKEESSDDS